MTTERPLIASPLGAGLEYGRYVVRSLVGEGSMAQVYRAYDPLAERDVALKVLRVDMGWRHGKSGRVRFQREAEAAGRLSHPNIVTIYDVTAEYIVMEYLDGVTLEQILHERPPLPLDEALAILQPLAAALDYSHTRGIVHRDVKPGNIIVLADGRPKLTDFGVAHLESTTITAPGEFLGSPSYMSPEQVDGLVISPRSDVFSLAAVSYEMLTGQRAFGGPNIPAALHAILHRMPPPLTRAVPGLPAHYDAVFAQALAKDPQRRHATPGEFAAALDGARYARTLAGYARGEGGPMPAPPPPGVPVGSLAAVVTRDLGPIPIAWRFPRSATDATRALRAPGVMPALVGLALAAAVMVGVVLARIPGRVPSGPPTLALQTQPADASVWLDDALLGSSPLAEQPLSSGPHTLVLDRAGYAPLRLQFEAPPAASASFRLTLHPKDTAAVRPSGATIVVTRPGGAIDSVQDEDPIDGDTAPRAVRASVSPDAILPPRRVRGAPPQFPAAALQERLQGTVVIELMVTTDGRAADLTIIESAGDLLDHAVLEAVSRWRFEPATLAGEPVPVRWQVRQKFIF